MSDTHRRFTRLQTRQEAKVSLPGGQILDCEITDFCQKGLNLAPLDSPDSEFPTAILEAIGSNVAVTFSNTFQERPADHVLTGKLVRVTPQSMGLFTDGVPADAYKALAQARAYLLASEQAPSGLLESESQAIMQDCVNFFRMFLADVWRRFLDKIMVRMHEHDASPLPLPDHSRFLSALLDVTNRGDEISRRHFSMIIERMHRLETTDHRIKEAETETELTFIDEVKFEDWLNIAAIFNRQEVEIRSPMYEFAQRFSRILPTPIDKGSDPFGPESVCLSFQESLRDVDMTNAMRAILYHLFGQSIAPGYPDLYERFIQLLAPLKPTSRILPVTDNAPPTRPSSGIPGEDMATQVSRLAEVAEKLFALYPANLSTQPMNAVAETHADLPRGLVNAAPTSESSGRPPLPPQQSWALLQQALHLPHHGETSRGAELASLPPTAPGNQAAPSQGRVIVNVDDLLGRLVGGNAGGQVGGGVVTPSGWQGKPSASGITLSHALATLLADHESAARLPRPQFERLDLLTNLINRAEAELPATSQIDALLVKLERPLYQSALRGDELLRQPDHPLRRLFNLVDRFAMAADDMGQFLDPELYALVDSIIDRTASQADADATVFAHACQNLEKVLKHPIQQRKQRVASYQELCESQRRQQEARRHVAELLDQRLSGRDIPKLLTRLLDVGWRHYLVMTQLRGDVQEIEAALDVLDDLIRSLADNQVAVVARRELIDRIEQGLSSTSIDTLQTEAFLQTLTARLTGSAQQTTETVPITAGWFASMLNPKHITEPTNTNHDLPKVGDWWTFTQGGKPVPMQLIWASQSPASLAFVNRSATRKSDLNMADFTRKVRKGDITPTESKDIPLLERSEHGVVDTVFRDLAKESSHDPVTGLLNRKGWLQAVKVCQQSGVDDSQIENTLCLLEFYPIHLVYDSCGVEAAESLARELATALRGAVGGSHPIAAIRDGVFAIFLARLSVETARRIADRLLEKLGSHHFSHGSQSFAINLAIGLAGCKPGLADAEAVMRRASAACNTAKTQGGDCLQVYEDKGDQLRERETLMEWAGKIDAILADDSLYLRCQRIEPVGADTPLQAYYEILLGIRQTKGPEVSPQAFIQAVELWQRSRDIDLWVANHAFRWIRAHPDVFAGIGGFSINLSASSLADASVLAALEQELGAGDLPTEKIMFEITETATLAGYGSARDFMRRIRRYGCKFCIDDFGSGNASYGYLKNLRTDTLKIDGAYVKDIMTDPNDLALVKSMNDIGHSLGMKTVAEYAATPEILAVLKEIGVDYVQGYAVHIPTPLDALLAPAK